MNSFAKFGLGQKAADILSTMYFSTRSYFLINVYANVPTTLLLTNFSQFFLLFSIFSYFSSFFIVLMLANANYLFFYCSLTLIIYLYCLYCFAISYLSIIFQTLFSDFSNFFRLFFVLFPDFSYFFRLFHLLIFDFSNIHFTQDLFHKTTKYLPY